MVNRNKSVADLSKVNASPSMAFKWSVSAEGYEVQELRRTRLIADRAAATQGISANRRTYEPLDDPGLYLRLSRTPTDAEAILEFANQYGLLEIDDWYYQSPENSPQKEPAREPLQVWVETIEELRAALRIFGFIQTNQILKLRECIVVDEVSGDDLDSLSAKSAVRLPMHLRTSVSMLDPLNPQKQLERQLVPDAEIVLRDPVAHAVGYLSRVSNKGLRERVAPRVYWDTIERRFQIQMAPTSLLGAVWLQFSLALAENKRVGTCRWCGAPFEVSRKSSRADRQHCSNRCRSKAYRHRRERAVELADAGHSLGNIADELGSDPKTVAGWISAAKDQGRGGETK